VRSARGFALVVVLVIAALAIGIGATLGYQKLTTKPTPSPSPAISQSPAPDDLSSEALAQDETINWKTYTSSDFKFSLKFPPDWKPARNPLTADINKIIFSAPDNGEIATPPEVIPAHNYARIIVVKVQNTDRSLTITDLKTDINNIASPNTAIEDIKIDNKNALRIKNIPGGGITEIWTSNGNRRYYLSHFEGVEVNKVDNPKYSKIFDQILSTFRFLD